MGAGGPWPRPLPGPARRARHCGNCGSSGPAERGAARRRHPRRHRRGPGSGSLGVGRAAAGRWPHGSGRGRPSVRALGRRRGPGPGDCPPPPARPGAGKRRLWGLRGGRAARPGGARERGRGGGRAAAGPRSPRPASQPPRMPWDVAPARAPHPGPAEGPAARRSLRAERRHRGSARGPSIPLRPVVLSPGFTPAPAPSPSSLVPFLACSLPSPSPQHHPLPVFPLVTLLPCPVSYHHKQPSLIFSRSPLFLSVFTFPSSHPPPPPTTRWSPSVRLLIG